MVGGHWHGKMVLNLMEISLMERKMEKVYIDGQMVPIMMAILKMMLWKVMVNLFGQMANPTKEIGWIMKWVVKELLYIWMVKYIKVSVKIK